MQRCRKGPAITKLMQFSLLCQVCSQPVSLLSDLHWMIQTFHVQKQQYDDTTPIQSLPLTDGLHRVNTVSVSCYLALSPLCVIMQTGNKNQALLPTLQHNGCFCMLWLDQSQEADAAILILLCLSTYITSLRFSVLRLRSVCLFVLDLSLLPKHPIISQLLNSLHHCWTVTTEN